MYIKTLLLPNRYTEFLTIIQPELNIYYRQSTVYSERTKSREQWHKQSVAAMQKQRLWLRSDKKQSVYCYMWN
jgi:hypothetical protein